MIGVRVPASTSNLGAGFDCLGLALDIWLEAWIEDGGGPPVYEGTVAGLAAAQDIVMQVLGGTVPATKHLRVRSDIPLALGFGSSAAAAVASYALHELLSNSGFERDRVYEAAVALEGHPDNAGAATYGGFVLAAPRPARLAFSQRLAVALAVPEAPIDTKSARQILPSQLPRHVAIAQSSRAAALVLGLMNAEADLIAHGMDDQIAVPLRKRLIPGYDDAVAAGREAGAYGVTISGSGSAILAVTEPERAADVAEAMADALRRHQNPAAALTPEVSEKGLSVLE